MSFAVGIAAALAAPLIMTIGFIVWDNCWKGSAFSLNLYKCNLASIGFLILSVTTRSGEKLFPSSIFTRTSVGYLMLSATIGILIGDWTWLEGLRLLGARRIILIDSCKPFLAALFGWAILGEELRPAAFGGMALTVTGVLIVSLEGEKEVDDSSEKHSEGEIVEGQGGEREVARGIPNPVGTQESGETTEEETTDMQQSEEMSESRSSEVDVNCDSEEKKKNPNNNELRGRILTPALSRRGYALGFLNVVLDTYGSLLTKEHGVGMSTWEINLIRFGFSGACMLALSAVMNLRQWILVRGHERKKDEESPDDEEQDKAKNTWHSLPRNMTRKAWLKVSMGVAFVTFLTPALSNYALFQIALALALTLGSVGPLYALPLTWLLQHDRPTVRACVGGILAVAGIVVLSVLGKQQQ